MVRKINHKVGVKVLTESQLENVLPTYENFFQKVEVCREVAQKELENKEKRHYQYNFMYDNVFSFLGERGTGKTSVAFTLQKMIRDKYVEQYQDIVLPLIIPEVIPENCTVLGWILAIVREEIAALEEKITHLQKGKDSEGYWSKCRHDEDVDSLKIKLDRLCQHFYAGSYNPSNEASYYKAVDYSVRQAVDYYNFGKGIAEIWDGWIERIQKAYELEKNVNGKTICPLIYFIFDDVDLAPDKIEELLSVIIKYLSHPNIIVLTTADEDMFLDVIEKSLDRKIGKLPVEWRNYLGYNSRGGYSPWRSSDSEEEERREAQISSTTRRYLGKVLPTSTRYYLCTFNTALQKENFCIEEQKSLGAAVEEEIKRLLECFEGKKVSNFMVSNEAIVNFYLKFFGNTSRQIGNVYIALQELINTLKSIVGKVQKGTLGEERALKKVYQNVRNFLNIAITANHDLAQYVDKVEQFVDEIYLLEYNQWTLYIDYAHLTDFLKTKLKSDKNPEKVRISMALYALTVFVENILLIMGNAVSIGITKRKNTHSAAYLSEYINEVVFAEQKLFREDLGDEEFFAHYSNMLDRLEIIAENKVVGAKFYMEYLYSFRTYSHKRMDNREELVKIFKSNPQWFGNLISMLTMVYGNAYLVTADDVRSCMISFSCLYPTSYQTRISRILKTNIINCFKQIKMQSIWETAESNLQEALSEVDGKETAFYSLSENVRKELEIVTLERVGVSQVLSIVRHSVLREVRRGQEYVDIIKRCPKEILHVLQSKKNQLLERKGKKGIMLRYLEEIEESEHDLGTQAILYDPTFAMEVLERLMERGLENYVQIREVHGDIGMAISKERTAEEDLGEGGDKNKGATKVFIPKFLYMRIKENLNKSMEILERSNDSYYDPDDDEQLMRMIQEVLDNLDIIVDIKNEVEWKKALVFVFEVFIVELMQRAYLAQLVAERYESGNAMSSRELEKVKKNDSYYYSLFNAMVELVQESDFDENNSEEDILNSGMDEEEDKSIVIMKRRIIDSYTREREKYVAELLAGDRNE